VKLDRLLPLLGIALVAGTVLEAATFFGLERKIQSDQAFAATLDRLYQDQKLCSALKTIQEGDVRAAARCLDLMLCDDILAINSQLASADERTRSYVEDAFARLALLRPGNALVTARAQQELYDDQIQAEKVLALASTGESHWPTGATASR
jgi:hypothetical protein